MSTATRRPLLTILWNDSIRPSSLELSGSNVNVNLRPLFSQTIARRPSTKPRKLPIRRDGNPGHSIPSLQGEIGSHVLTQNDVSFFLILPRALTVPGSMNCGPDSPSKNKPETISPDNSITRNAGKIDAQRKWPPSRFANSLVSTP